MHKPQLYGMAMIASIISAALVKGQSLVIPDPNGSSGALYDGVGVGLQNNTSTFDFYVGAPNADPSVVLDSLTIDPVVDTATGDIQPVSSMGLAIYNEETPTTPIETTAFQPVVGTAPITFNNLNTTLWLSEPALEVVVEVNAPPPADTSAYKGAGSLEFQAEATGATYTPTGSSTPQSETDSLAGHPQYFFSAVSYLSSWSSSISSMGALPNGQTIGLNGSITLLVQPTGPMNQPVASDFQIGVGQTLQEAESDVIPADQVTIGSIDPAPDGPGDPLDANQTYYIELDMTALADEFPQSGTYAFFLLSADTTVANGYGTPIEVDQNWGPNAETYGIPVTVVPEPASLGVLGLLAFCRPRCSRRA